MSQPELRKKVVHELERFRISYMVTGSIASSLQGEPRSTHDIDLVVAIRHHQAELLANSFQMPDYYLDKDAVIEAIDKGPMFNLLDCVSGDKVDFWILTDEAFDQSRFRRRRSENVFGESIYFSTPEDTILMKLKWAEMSGGSDKQISDCLRIFEVQHENLDLEYLSIWAQKLNVSLLLARIQNEANL